jgi:hypothetical protein
VCFNIRVSNPGYVSEGAKHFIPWSLNVPICNMGIIITLLTELWGRLNKVIHVKKVCPLALAADTENGLMVSDSGQWAD